MKLWESGRKGTMFCKLYWYPKFTNEVFSICYKLQVLSTEGIILCNIIGMNGDVHHFCFHCLIPLDPCLVNIIGDSSLSYPFRSLIPNGFFNPQILFIIKRVCEVLIFFRVGPKILGFEYLNQ